MERPINGAAENSSTLRTLMRDRGPQGEMHRGEEQGASSVTC